VSAGGGRHHPPPPPLLAAVGSGGGEGGSTTCDCQAEAVLEAKLRLTKMDKLRLN
jgi:hypothetical protein